MFIEALILLLEIATGCIQAFFAGTTYGRDLFLVGTFMYFHARPSTWILVENLYCHFPSQKAGLEVECALRIAERTSRDSALVIA